MTTVKRLFAVSQNRCAFPACDAPLAAENVVLGDICHIKAQRPDGPRYDENQPEDQRHAFENLVLMCKPHHKIIDTDFRSYTVERLTEIKAEHEAKCGRDQLASDDKLASQFVVNMNSASVGGSSIVNINQSGGQVAHSITNIGPQPRVISAATARELTARLRGVPPETIEVRALMGDAEAGQLAKQFVEIAGGAGWSVHETWFMPATSIKGVVLCIEKPRPGFDALLIGLRAAGIQAVGELGPLVLKKSPNVTGILVVAYNLA